MSIYVVDDHSTLFASVLASSAQNCRECLEWARQHTLLRSRSKAEFDPFRTFRGSLAWIRSLLHPSDLPAAVPVING